MHFRDLFVYSGLALAVCASSRSIKVPAPDVHAEELVSRDVNNRCGPEFGKCPYDRCCSTSGMIFTPHFPPDERAGLTIPSGFCGTSPAHCRSPDCQINFGHCDASLYPEGPPTEKIPRPKIGSVTYAPNIIRSCVVPGTIALTFDDGPREYTSELLDLLERYHAKATFFVTGNNGGKGSIDDPDLPWGDLIRRMQRSGHQIASHTWTHQDLSKITHEQRMEQILKNEMALRNVLGAFPTYMRPPYSSCLPESGCLADLGELGYHIVLYDIDTSDYSHDSPGAIQVSKDIFNDALAPWKASEKSWMIIAHDVHEQTVHNLTEHMLREIEDHGYRAVTVGQCLNDPEEFWYREDRNAPTRTNNGNRTKNSKDNKDKKPFVISVSPDGTCGVNTTCSGSIFGQCCSHSNYCGNSNAHCDKGCQPEFGRCIWHGSDKVLPNGTIIDEPRSPEHRGKGWMPIDEERGPWGPKPKKSDGVSLFHTGISMAALILFVSAVLLLS